MLPFIVTLPRTQGLLINFIDQFTPLTVIKIFSLASNTTHHIQDTTHNII